MSKQKTTKAAKLPDMISRAELVRALKIEVAMTDKFSGELLRKGEKEKATEWAGAGKRLAYIHDGLVKGEWPPAMAAPLRVVEKPKGSPAPPLKRNGKKRS
jgi:hypothetical protein